MTNLPGTSQSGQRWRTRATALLIVASFGPYMWLPGLRTEQAAVYGLCGLGLALCLWLKARPAGVGAAVALLWAVHLLVAAAGALQPSPAPPGFGLGSVAAGFDNAALPLAVMLTIWMLVGDGGGGERLLRVACGTLVFAACVNAALAIWSINSDITWLLRPFWGGGDGLSVAERSQLGGRYAGIFNQPAEAGAMYSMALLAAIWLNRDRSGRLAVTAACIVIGGIVAASKNFLLIGLPIGAWQMLRLSTGRQRRLVGLACVVVVVVAATQFGIGTEWAGGRMITNMLHPDSNGYGAADLYTAGRFSERSRVWPAVEAILAASPWFGFGAGGLLVAYDTAWLEALAVSGLIGVLAYTGVLLLLVVAWWRLRPVADKPRSQFAGGLIVVLVGASFGLPALTANRVATVAWLLVTLLLLVRCEVVADEGCEDAGGHPDAHLLP